MSKPSRSAVIAVLHAVIIALIWIIWSMRRHEDPVLRVNCELSARDGVRSFADLSLSSPIQGNHIKVLENGAFFDILIDRILAARSTIHFETWLWADGVLATRVAGALIGQARAGLHVRVLLDAVG